MFLDMYHDNTVVFWTYYSKYHNFCTCTTAILQYFGQVTIEIPCFWTCTMVLACIVEVTCAINQYHTTHQSTMYYPTDIITYHGTVTVTNQYQSSYQSINHHDMMHKKPTTENCQTHNHPPPPPPHIMGGLIHTYKRILLLLCFNSGQHLMIRCITDTYYTGVWSES